MATDNEICITNIDAARRQLATAIKMWFHDDDPISIHTLSHASHEIIDGLSKAIRKRDLLYDNLICKDEYRKKFNDSLRKPGNFFKHPSRDRKEDRSISFSPKVSELFILFSILGVEQLGKTKSPEEATFMQWHYFHKPDHLTEEGKKLFIDSLEPGDLEKIRSIKKHDFFKACVRINGGAGLSA